MIIEKFNRSFYPSFILLIVLSAIIIPETTQAAQIFSMDAGSFRQRGGLIYQEIYFMIQRDRLQFVQTVDGYEALYQITTELHSQDSLLSTTSWEMVDRTLQLEDITPRQKLPDIVVFNLDPGEYTVVGTVIDLNLNASYQKSLFLKLDAYPEDKLAISDIELATKLTKGEEGSKFYKNGFLVIPNPEKMYGTSLPMLYYYSEIYNLIPGEGEYTVNRSIMDDSRELLNQLPAKTKQKIAESVVELDGFSVSSLTSGTYYLKIAVYDNEAGDGDSTEAKFFVYRPEDFVGDEPAEGGTGESASLIEFSSMNGEQIEEAIDELKYFLGDNDWRNLENLNEDGKRLVLIRFWSERDPEPATAVNEFRKIIVDRKEYANQKFGIWGKAGWKSNRGRVHILYGEPDYIEYHTHDPGSRSYQVWFYDTIEGGVQFVFVDRNNFGEYRLVHSSKQGELYRANWFEEEALIHRP